MPKTSGELWQAHPYQTVGLKGCVQRQPAAQGQSIRWPVNLPDISNGVQGTLLSRIDGFDGFATLSGTASVQADNVG
jgi:hypothetical protein